MDGPAALSFLAEVSLSHVPIVLLSIHTVSCAYFLTSKRLVQYLFFKQPLEGNRIFLAEENGEIIGYLFGNLQKSKKQQAAIPDGASYFEVEELYVKPSHRSGGVGSALFRYMEAQVRPEAEYLMLGTATKNFRAILHFYIDELGMEFWSAALFKKL